MRIEKSIFRQIVLWGSILCLTLLYLAGCRSEPQAEQSPQQTVRLDSVEVYKVKLEKALIRPDVKGEARSWEEAFMIRFSIGKPPAMGPKFDIFLDEERITEFGSWKEGIYFWVYDPARLEALEGRAISYQFDRCEKYEIGTLNLGNQQEFRQVHEEELRGQ